MAHLDPNLLKRISDNPDQVQNVIVRVNGDMDAIQSQLEGSGFKIRRKLGLIKGFATTAPGKNVRRLAEQPWVVAIETDQQVHTT